MNTATAKRIAETYGFKMLVGNGIDIFTKGNVQVTREGISHGITVNGERKPSVNSGLENALMVADQFYRETAGTKTSIGTPVVFDGFSASIVSHGTAEQEAAGLIWIAYKATSRWELVPAENCKLSV